MDDVTCSVDGCGGPARKRGWCSAHYKRWRTTGGVQAQIPVRRAQPKAECSIEECPKRTHLRGWCRPHYRRWQEYGDPLGNSPRMPCAWPSGCGELVWVAKSRTGMCAYHADRMRRKANPKRVNDGNRRYARKHPEQVSAWSKKWRDANPDKQRDYRSTRIARERGQFVERVYRSVVFRRDKGRCGICHGKVDPVNWHLDHIVPISRGGEHSYANVQVAHPFCNVSKGAKLIEHQMALL